MVPADGPSSCESFNDDDDDDVEAKIAGREIGVVKALIRFDDDVVAHRTRN